jgi:hypothetical protein
MPAQESFVRGEKIDGWLYAMATDWALDLGIAGLP